MLTLLAFCFYGAFFLIEELKMGQTYSQAVVFGDNTIVHESSSPKAYWTDIGLYAFGFLGGFIAAIFGFREVIIEHKRKNAANAKK
jgi:hypothetical protein